MDGKGQTDLSATGVKPYGTFRYLRKCMSGLLFLLCFFSASVALADGGIALNTYGNRVVNSSILYQVYFLGAEEYSLEMYDSKDQLHYYHTHEMSDTPYDYFYHEVTEAGTYNVIIHGYAGDEYYYESFTLTFTSKGSPSVKPTIKVCFYTQEWTP